MLIRVPSEGTPGGKPNPRNVSPISIPIFPAKSKIALIIRIELIFGKIPPNIIFQAGVPIVLDALI